MKRAILRKGDKSTSGGTVTEGIETFTVYDIPATFIGAKVWCPGCKSEGKIGSTGPHRDVTILDKRQALDGDLCVCRCIPSPVLIASQDSAYEAFTASEWNAAYGHEPGRSTTRENRGAYDEQIHATGNGATPGYPYFIEIPDGRRRSGRLDGTGLIPRVDTAMADSYTVYWGDDALAHIEWY